MTMVVGDDADVLESNLSFHLNAGVDAVVVGAENPAHETRAILERFEREGRVRVLRDRVTGTRDEWLERAARFGATELGADWVIAALPDEFWWPRGGTLRELLSEIPAQYDAIQGLVRPFLSADNGDGSFADRMVYRLSAQALSGDLDGPWRPSRKLVCRARAAVERGSTPRPLRGWYPIDVLWFPIRSAEQLARSDEPWRNRRYVSLMLDGSELERGLAGGVVRLDTRLRDALRSIQAGRAPLFPRPTVVESALLGVDAAVLGEADVLTARQCMDELEQRLGAVEASVGVRLERKLRSLVRRGRRTA
jgi:hypothetical protein